MKKFLLIIIIFAHIFIIGCEGRTEINDLGIVTIMGIDWNEATQEYNVTVNVIKLTPKTEIKKSAMESNWISSASGKTIYSATQNLRSRSSLELNWAADSVFIVGQEAAKHGLRDIIDYLIRFREIRDTAHVLTTDIEASNMMKALPEENQENQREIESIIRFSDWAMAYVPEIREVYTAFNEKKGDIVTGAIFSVKPAPYSQVPTEKIGDKGVASIEGVAIYKSGKFVGFLNKYSTRAYFISKNKMNEPHKPVFVLTNPGEGQDSKVSVEIINEKSDVNVSLEGEVTANIKIKLEAEISEMIAVKEQVDERFLNSISKNLNNKVKSEIEVAFKEMQEKFDSDILGIGELIHRKYPNYWKKNKQNWNDIYPKIKFDIQVDSKIKRLGYLINPI